MPLQRACQRSEFRLREELSLYQFVTDRSDEREEMLAVVRTWRVGPRVDLHLYVDQTSGSKQRW